MMGPRAFLPALAFAGLLAVPAGAQIIPAGKDYWVTYGTGNTFAEIPYGEVESLCGANPDPSWNRTIAFQGVPVIGDADTIVARLADADLSADDAEASVPVQVVALHFVSIGSHATPCGDLTFEVGLTDEQPVTKMTITRTSDKGGFFNSDLRVNIEIIARKADDPSSELGRLYYTYDLPDPGATVWTFSSVYGFAAAGGWLPAVGTKKDCFAVARAKINTPPYKGPAAHEYYIAKYQALGICPPPPR